MALRHFKSAEEVEDLRELLRQAKDNGAESGGIFGSRLGSRWTDRSDIDVVVNTPGAPYYGQVDVVRGERSGSVFHIFTKRPGKTNGSSRSEQILDTAETTYKPLFGHKR